MKISFVAHKYNYNFHLLLARNKLHKQVVAGNTLLLIFKKAEFCMETFLFCAATFVKDQAVSNIFWLMFYHLSNIFLYPLNIVIPLPPGGLLLTVGVNPHVKITTIFTLSQNNEEIKFNYWNTLFDYVRLFHFKFRKSFL